jgi:hypothetical protein
LRYILITTILCYPKGDKNRLFNVKNKEIKIIRNLLPCIEYKDSLKDLYHIFAPVSLKLFLLIKELLDLAQREITTFLQYLKNLTIKIFCYNNLYKPEALINTRYAKIMALFLKLATLLLKHGTSDYITTLTPRKKNFWIKFSYR